MFVSFQLSGHLVQCGGNWTMILCEVVLLLLIAKKLLCQKLVTLCRQRLDINSSIFFVHSFLSSFVRSFPHFPFLRSFFSSLSLLLLSFLPLFVRSFFPFFLFPSFLAFFPLFSSLFYYLYTLSRFLV